MKSMWCRFGGIAISTSTMSDDNSKAATCRLTPLPYQRRPMGEDGSVLAAGSSQILMVKPNQNISAGASARPILMP
jgi:hypothetical protein